MLSKLLEGVRRDMNDCMLCVGRLVGRCLDPGRLPCVCCVLSLGCTMGGTESHLQTRRCVFFCDLEHRRM